MTKLKFQWKLEFWSVQKNLVIVESAHRSLEVKQLQQPGWMSSAYVPPSLPFLIWLTGVSRQPNGLWGSSFFLSCWGTNTKIQWLRWFLPIITSLWMCVCERFPSEVGLNVFWVWEVISQRFHFAWPCSPVHAVLSPVSQWSLFFCLPR